MKKQLALLVLLLAFNLFSTILFSQTCPGVAVTYPHGVFEDMYIIPSQAYYTDGTLPSQYGDGNGNLIVTWPYAGQGYLYAYVFNGEAYSAVNVPITIGSVPIFSSAITFLCNGQTGTYSVSDACTSNYTWNAPNGWSINGGSNSLYTSSQSVSITAPSTGSGYVTITVTSDANYSSPISKIVWFGTPSISGPTVTGPCEDPTYTYRVPNGAASYNWSISNPNLSLSDNGSSVDIDAGNASIGGNSFYLYLTITAGSCSFNLSRLGTYILKSPTQCGGGGGGGGGKLRLAAPDSVIADDPNSFGSEQKLGRNLPYPNPANNQFSVIVEGQNSLTLTSSTGKIISQFSGDGRIDVDTHDLVSGLYFLCISNGKELTRKKIIVSH